MAERVRTINVPKGSNIVLPCSLNGAFAFPEWQGPPYDAYYTHQGQDVLNQQVPSISEGRLSWHANQADLNLQNVMESDKGSYKCFFKGLGIFKVELLVSGMNSTVPDHPRNAGDESTIATIIVPIVVWICICSLGIWCLYSKCKRIQGHLCSLKILLFLATFYLLLGWIIWICYVVCCASKASNVDDNDQPNSANENTSGQCGEHDPLVFIDHGTSRDHEDDEDSDTHQQPKTDQPDRISLGITDERENEYQKGASIEGLRVVRGPNWSYDNKDGGEGHVGTVTNDNKDGTVEVQWDMGERSTFNTGKDNKFDLGILDNASTGLKHLQVTCGGCKDYEFPGTRWQCQMCDNFDLCSKCYFSDQDDVNHIFIRIDGIGLSGCRTDVPPRESSIKFRAMGIFQEAKVRRGKDWSYGDQDGGNGQIGTVLEVQTSAVSVIWPNKTRGSYRLGLDGKVDLTCVKESAGMYYYKDHLLSLDNSSAASSSSSDNDNIQGNDSDNDTLEHLIANLSLLHNGVGPKLLIAAAVNNDNTVQKILKENPALINEKHQCLTALIIAAHEGHVEVVKTLLSLNANPNLTEEKGNTALMTALMKSRKEVAMLLIEAGTKLDICNESMRCALHFAASYKVNDTLKELLKRGANPNQQDNAGDTPLHAAIININDFGAAFLVADKRTNLKLCNKGGFPPLHLAALKDCDMYIY